jgi:hypothetical protein
VRYKGRVVKHPGHPVETAQTTSLATIPAPLSRDIIREIAMDIGKATAHHIKTMYPDAVKATSENMLLSVRNTVFNEIMAALEVIDEDAIRERLAERKRHRRFISRMARPVSDTREAAPTTPRLQFMPIPE